MAYLAADQEVEEDSLEPTDRAIFSEDPDPSASESEEEPREDEAAIDEDDDDLDQREGERTPSPPETAPAETETHSGEVEDPTLRAFVERHIEIFVDIDEESLDEIGHQTLEEKVKQQALDGRTFREIRKGADREGAVEAE